jgi:hypothetical protein
MKTIRIGEDEEENANSQEMKKTGGKRSQAR